MNAIPFFSLTSPQAQTLEPDADSTDSESEVEKALFDPPGMRVRTLTGNSTQAKEGSTPMDEATAEASVPKEDSEVRVHLSPSTRVDTDGTHRLELARRTRARTGTSVAAVGCKPSGLTAPSIPTKSSPRSSGQASRSCMAG